MFGIVSNSSKNSYTFHTPGFIETLPKSTPPSVGQVLPSLGMGQENSFRDQLAPKPVSRSPALGHGSPPLSPPAPPTPGRGIQGPGATTLDEGVWPVGVSSKYKGHVTTNHPVFSALGTKLLNSGPDLPSSAQITSSCFLKLTRPFLPPRLCLVISPSWQTASGPD